MKDDFQYQRQGSVLLLALLVLSAIMAGSVALGAIVMNGIRQARTVDNSIVAYYAAESGVEESLYQVRKLDKSAFDIANSGKNLDNGAKWNIGNYGTFGLPGIEVSDLEPQFNLFELPANKFVQFDLYDTGQGPIQSLVIKGDNQGGGWIEASWFGWNLSNSNISNFKTIQFPPDTKNGRIVNLSLAGGGYDRYRIKIKALYNKINNLNITAYVDASGTNPVGGAPIPSRIDVNVYGEYRGSRQKLKYAMPRQSPLGGLFDFVLFSECSILKGITEECQ